MKFEIYNRRVRMINLMSEGYKPKKIVDSIVKEFGISERHAWREWGKRKVWMRDVVNEESDEIKFFGLYESLVIVKKDLWKIADETKNYGLKVRALKIIGEISFKQIDLLQSLGKLPFLNISEHNSE